MAANGRDDEEKNDGAAVSLESFVETSVEIATTERLVEDVIGCGQFQALVTLLVTILAKIPTAATFMFMAFGNYNPGWRCLDDDADSNDTSNNNSLINTTTHGTYIPIGNHNNVTAHGVEYITDSCEAFEACSHVQFNPDSSTIVTEWGLLCNRSWISSLIVSVQMVGALIGSIVAGQLGDSIGRKTVVYSCIAIMAIFNTVSMFSTSWQMFASFRFFQGAAASSLLASYYVLTNEFIPNKWRGPNNSIPAWNAGTILFSVIAYFVRDWRILHMSTAIMAVLCFIPVFWVPESLRWLAVKKKQKRFYKVVEKMTSMNKKSLPPSDTLDAIVTNAFNQNKPSKKYRLYHLFHPGFRMYTFIFSFIWMSVSIIYYAISFGVKSLYGDFYINLILLFTLEMPFAICHSFVPNLLGRVKGTSIFILFAVACMLTCAGIELWGSVSDKEIGSIIVLLSKVALNSGWCIHILHTAEIYPTVVRSLSIGWGCLMARCGGIIAPFIIPNDKGTVYISYIAMAILALLCCRGVIKLPETKGRSLPDTFDDEDHTGD